MILTALLKNYRIQEFIQFISNTLMIVNQHNAEQLNVSTPLNELSQNHQLLEDAYKQNKSSDLTIQLAMLDFRRDQSIKCLRQISFGYTYHYDETFQAAGRTIVDCIDKFGNTLYELNYEAETAALKNLTTDLQNLQTCVSAVEKLIVGNIVTEMVTSNNEFETLFVERLGEYSMEDAKTTKELMQQVADSYKKLTNHIEAHNTLTPTEEYTNVINHLNENIAHFNQVVENRKDSE